MNLCKYTNLHMETLTPNQAAKEFGISPMTVYQWITSGQLAASQVAAGLRTRLTITREEIERRKTEIASFKDRSARPPMKDEEHKKWVDRYFEIIGAAPPMLGAFRLGKVTFEQMQTEAKRRLTLIA